MKDEAKNGFRPINEDEKKIVRRLIKQGSAGCERLWPAEVLYRRQGNFTEAVVVMGNRVFIGTSKRSVNRIERARIGDLRDIVGGDSHAGVYVTTRVSDPDNPIIGERAAFTRAMRQSPLFHTNGGD